MSSPNDESTATGGVGGSGGIDVTSKGVVSPAWKGRMVGHFKLLSILGQGAMGKVFRAEDVSLRRHVALKVMPQKVVQGDKTYKLDQFYREARSAATLEHPNVVTIYEVNQTSGVYYIAMELIEGGNLDEMVKGSGPLDPIRACQLCAEAAEALYYGHQHGIIHRDVKPANLMLTRGGRCKLADFGLAHLDDPNDPFNLPTEAVGTPQYVAPEVASGQPASALSDVYSLGGTLWYLLAGKPPYVGKTKKDLLRAQISGPVPDLMKVRPELGEGLAKVIKTAMAKVPEERYASADQFAKVLRSFTIPVGSMSGHMSGHLSGSVGMLPPGVATVGSASGGISAVGMQSGHMSGVIVVDPRAQKRRNLLIAGGSVAVGILVACAIFAVLSMNNGGGGYVGGPAAIPAPGPAPTVSSQDDTGGVAVARGPAAEIPTVESGAGTGGGVAKPPAPAESGTIGSGTPPAPTGAGSGGAVTPAPVPVPVPAPAPAPAAAPAGKGTLEVTEYVVQSGDTLYNIALRRYGAGTPAAIKRITDANAGLSAGTLQKGMTIKLPDAPAGGEAEIAKAPTGGTVTDPKPAGTGTPGSLAAAGTAKVYSPDDMEELAKLGAQKSRPEVIVEGEVVRAETSTSGKVTTITLQGANGAKRFPVVYFPQQFAAMEQAFGGKNGAGINGKRVRVRGRVEVYREQPQIVVEDVKQVTVVQGKE